MEGGELLFDVEVASGRLSESPVFGRISQFLLDSSPPGDEEQLAPCRQVAHPLSGVRRRSRSASAG